MRSATTHAAISSAFDSLSAPYPAGKRPGYYVEGKFYRDQFHQARARAAWLSQQYGKGITTVIGLDPQGRQKSVKNTVAFQARAIKRLILKLC